MKKFFEQMIMDSVSAVKDELLARLAESGNKLKNQQDNSSLQRDIQGQELKSYQVNQTTRLQKNEPTLRKNIESFDDDDELPFVAYPDSPDEYHEKISEPIEDNREDDFSDSKDFRNIDCIASQISPAAHRSFFANRDNFSDSEHKISMLNAYNKNRRLNIMILGAVFGLVFCLLMLTFYKGDLPGEVVGIISTVSGIFGSCLKDAYSFEFGSSRGSKEKDDKITSTLLKRLKI